tara:strand:+ start:48572 stop:49042 length:471 start_codon:yes stop_codon:yes gene_type:complete
MKIAGQLAKHVKELYFGGNWTSVSLKSVLTSVNQEMACHKIPGFNSIYELVFHLNYYVHEVGKVLDGEPLNAKDEKSFSAPEITSQKEWEDFLAQVWKDGIFLVTQIEKLPDTVLNEAFTDEKYGSYFRNLLGIIEHSHYHLGQIAMLKKLQKRAK